MFLHRFATPLSEAKLNLNCRRTLQHHTDPRPTIDQYLALERKKSIVASSSQTIFKTSPKQSLSQTSPTKCTSPPSAPASPPGPQYHPKPTPPPAAPVPIILRSSPKLSVIAQNSPTSPPQAPHSSTSSRNHSNAFSPLCHLKSTVFRQMLIS